MRKRRIVTVLVFMALALVVAVSTATAQEGVDWQRPFVSFEIESYYYGFGPDEIVVQEGDHVRLVVSNNPHRQTEGLVEFPEPGGDRFQDHGLGIDEFDVDTGNIEPNETVIVEFIADEAGEFTMYCSVWCGNGTMRGGKEFGHSDQVATLKVLPAD